MLEKTDCKAKRLTLFKIKNENAYNTLSCSPLHPLGVTPRRMKNFCPNKTPDFRYIRKCGHRRIFPELLFQMKNKYFQIGSCHKSARWALNRCKNADTRNITPSTEPKLTANLSALSG